VPRGTVDPRFVAGVQIFLRTAAPFFAAGNHFEFDDTFCAEKHRDHAVELLRGVRHVDAGTFFQSGSDLGFVDDLRKMRRADFFFAFSDEDDVNGELLPCCFDRDQSGEQRRFGTFLVDGAAADDNLAHAGFVDQARFEWR